ncbi:MAG TPA: alpha/beta hydrolase, partial [Anaerolineales bacterium]|nr:alpha/beta hydrolase [Anaerolineales bacterium]
MKTIDAIHVGDHVRPRSFGLGRILRTVALALGSILLLLLTMLLALPVILLPSTTAVPALFWVVFAIADMVLISLPFRLAPTGRGVVIGLGGMMAVGLIAITMSQFFAMTPPITDTQGNAISGSIASLEKVKLNGSEQWISIRGKDRSKPVLLFLAGGPGGSQLVTARRALAGLADHFVVVNWEQPGAGKSFDAVDRSTLTPERYITDGLELVSYLQKRFDEEKVYLLGESWGSALGIWMVQREPESFHALIGTGQMVAFLENDLMCYDFAIRWAQTRGDTEKVEKLQKQ